MQTPVPSTWDPHTLQQVSARFEERSPRDLLRWTFAECGERAVMGTGFGYSGVALMHMLAAVRPGATVFYMDTDLLFEETRALRAEIENRLDLHIVRVHSGVSLEEQREEHGPALWKRNPDQCCFIRKVRPLRRYLSDKPAWITALRRDQSPTRSGTDLVEWNATHGLAKVNPLAHWTEEDVWRYIHAHDLPYNSLHDEGYPSIGCKPCTAPVHNGDDKRAGRWAGHAKIECGLHPES